MGDISAKRTFKSTGESMFEELPSELERRFRCALAFHTNVVELAGVDPSSWTTYSTTAAAESDLTLALALLSPEVAPVEPSVWKSIRGSRAFPYAPYPVGDHCWSHLVWGYSCPRKDGLQLDHQWPYSLGGPSSVENGIWLCRMHNRAKSDDVHLYVWPTDTWPSWVTRRIALIARAMS